MSLDHIVAFLYNVIDFFKKRKIPEFYIERKFLRNNKTSVLKIILSPRGDSVPPTDKILFKRLYRKGYSCLYYYISGSVLSTDPYKTVENFNMVKNQVRFDVSKLKTEYHLERIDIITSSMGAVSACLIANNNDNINNISLIAPGSTLASSLWNGIRTQDLRKIYEEQGVNHEKLKNIWTTIEPKNNIDTLSDKRIFISISKSDKVIPYVFGKELPDLIRNLYPNNISVKENKYLGHYFTVVKYYLFSKELLK